MKVSRKALPEDIAESRISKGPVSISATDVFGVAEGPIPELMVIKQRAGKGILSESLERIAPVLNPNAQEMLTEWAEKAKPSRDPEGVKTTKWVESFDRKREILDMLHLFHDRPLNYMETVALLAVRHGLDKEKLLPYVRDLFQMSQCGIVNLGGISGLYSSIKDNLPVKIENILEDSPRPITGDEIGRSLGYNMDVSQRERNSILYRINASLNLLETVNHVVKLPKDKSLTVWIHPKYRYSPETVPEWNLKYTVLKVLYGQSKISGAGTVKDGMMKGDIASSDELEKL